MTTQIFVAAKFGWILERQAEARQIPAGHETDTLRKELCA